MISESERSADKPLGDAQRLAERAAAAMWADDVAPGRATVTMTVRADMVNGHAICHGGFVFALADSAFAFACNSYNRIAVAQDCDIVFVAPARLGDVLTAEATERVRYGRNGIYDVQIRRADEIVAEFRGRSREIGGTLTE